MNNNITEYHKQMSNYTDSDITDNFISNDELSFIDLCCGIGGFHMAIKNIIEIKSKLLLASDIDKNCRKTYYLNHKSLVYNDFTKINFNDKKFDMLFAGFPCQPFSVSGKRLGIDDIRGTIIYDIFKLIESHKPKIVCLENVKGLKSIKESNDTKLYDFIVSKFKSLNYYIYDRVLSPHQINIPQKRERIIFICIRKDCCNKSYKDNDEFVLDREIFVNNLIKEFKNKNKNINIFQNEENVNDEYKLNIQENQTISLWRKFISMKEWDEISNDELQNIYKQQKNLNKCSKNFKRFHFFTDFLLYKNTRNINKTLVNYKTRKDDKISSSFKNTCDILNILYENHDGYKNLIDKFLHENKSIIDLLSYQNRYLEYCGDLDFGSNNSIDNFYGQLRMSGFRVRHSKYFPTLVKSGPLPIVIKKNRYLTDVECSKLQSLHNGFTFINKSNMIKQIGNGVNVEIIEIMLRSVIFLLKDIDNYKNSDNNVVHNEISTLIENNNEEVKTRNLSSCITIEKSIKQFFINNIHKTITICGTKYKILSIEKNKNKKCDLTIKTHINNEVKNIGIQVKKYNYNFIENWINMSLIENSITISNEINELKSFILNNINKYNGLYKKYLKTHKNSKFIKFGLCVGIM
jgi:DNA (cytosine-5)-methyltransferase 1